MADVGVDAEVCERLRRCISFLLHVPPFGSSPYPLHSEQQHKQQQPSPSLCHRRCSSGQQHVRSRTHEEAFSRLVQPQPQPVVSARPRINGRFRGVKNDQFQCSAAASAPPPPPPAMPAMAHVDGGGGGMGAVSFVVDKPANIK